MRANAFRRRPSSFNYRSLFIRFDTRPVSSRWSLIDRNVAKCLIDADRQRVGLSLRTPLSIPSHRPLSDSRSRTSHFKRLLSAGRRQRLPKTSGTGSVALSGKGRSDDVSCNARQTIVQWHSRAFSYIGCIINAGRKLAVYNTRVLYDQRRSAVVKRDCRRGIAEARDVGGIDDAIYWGLSGRYMSPCSHVTYVTLRESGPVARLNGFMLSRNSAPYIIAIACAASGLVSLYVRLVLGLVMVPYVARLGHTSSYIQVQGMALTTAGHDTFVGRAAIGRRHSRKSKKKRMWIYARRVQR
jgi:hypothetical protein